MILAKGSQALFDMWLKVTNPETLQLALHDKNKKVVLSWFYVVCNILVVVMVDDSSEYS